MWFYIKLAWRNIFRNKRRTIITGVAIGLGLAGLVFTDALMSGMKNHMIKSATSTFLGEAQIHCQNFRTTREVEKTIKNLQKVAQDLGAEEIVDRFTMRVQSFGMISSPANVSSITLFGIQPKREQNISRIEEAIEQGDFFAGEDKREIVIGSELADILRVSLKDRVVVTVSQASTGDLSQELFRISGIYQFDIKEMDTGMAFIPLEKAQQMLGLKSSQVHEIAIKFKKLDYATRKDMPFWERYARYGNEIAPWTELVPNLKAVFDILVVSLFFTAGILFGLVSFGIINTLFMSLYERLFEFGVLRAVGTRPSGVRKLIIFESGAMAILSIFLGSVMGLAAIFITNETGIDYKGIEFAGVTIYEMLYPVLRARQFIIYPLALLIFTLIIGLYPATIAGKMSITEALRKSL